MRAPPPLERVPEVCLPGGACFADRTWLWVALGVFLGLALAFALDFTRRRRLLEKIGHVPQLRRMADTLSPGRRIVKASLIVVGMVCLSLALAHPQVEGESLWRQRGIDLVVVMDFSKSMYALDVRPSRLARARLEADALLDGLEGDRVAVVAFSGGAVHYPLTTDYDSAKFLYHGISPEDMSPGSNVAEALTLARCLLRPDLDRDEACARTGGRGRGGEPLDEAEARRRRERGLVETELGERARAVVLFTDGEQTEGDAMEAVAAATASGVEVFVVGVGTPTGAPVPEYDDEGQQRGWKNDEHGETVISRLDEAGLKALAKAGGGEDHYLRLHPGRVGMEPIVNALKRLKEGDLESRVQKRRQEAFQWLLYPGFLALVIEACISDRRRRKKVVA